MNPLDAYEARWPVAHLRKYRQLLERLAQSQQTRRANAISDKADERNPNYAEPLWHAEMAAEIAEHERQIAVIQERIAFIDAIITAKEKEEYHADTA